MGRHHGIWGSGRRLRAKSGFQLLGIHQSRKMSGLRENGKQSRTGKRLELNFATLAAPRRVSQASN
jgi:hypothetical protein